MNSDYQQIQVYRFWLKQRGLNSRNTTTTWPRGVAYNPANVLNEGKHSSCLQDPAVGIFPRPWMIGGQRDGTKKFLIMGFSENNAASLEEAPQQEQALLQNILVAMRLEVLPLPPAHSKLPCNAQGMILGQSLKDHILNLIPMRDSKASFATIFFTSQASAITLLDIFNKHIISKPQIIYPGTFALDSPGKACSLSLLFSLGEIIKNSALKRPAWDILKKL